MKDIVLVSLPFVLLVPLWVFIWATIQQRRHPPTPEQLESARALGDPRWLPSGRAAVVFLFVYLGAYGARRFAALPAALETVLLVVPVLVFAWFVVAFLREFRRGDEFERRIQGEAASSALWTFMSWSVAMWVMDEIWPTPHHGTFSAALGFLPLYYAVGLFVAKVKYFPTRRANDEIP